MQAIQTVYKGPTNSNGSRIIAKCEAKRIVVPWDYTKDVVGNHFAAAHKLAMQLGWAGVMFSGSLPDRSYAHVFSYPNP